RYVSTVADAPAPLPSNLMPRLCASVAVRPGALRGQRAFAGTGAARGMTACGVACIRRCPGGRGGFFGISSSKDERVREGRRGENADDCPQATWDRAIGAVRDARR